ncbi:amino acid transporter [Sphingopyxis sp. BSNA05]|uniref:APC family permease n=1 Tax=Sphingopyxis sp. BSNA05 TaxID=1236614 RepID=UPI0015661970|nr:APC family permease [Sphingopyxis sp. BSNA05]NRD89087.1 amino acid transporter [Sphingopyxis sp. BSNA05]
MWKRSTSESYYLRTGQNDKTEISKIGTLTALSIGIGGMVGGGIFAVTGLTVQLTKGAAPVAFIVAGIVALLTSYSYLRLTLKYPSSGGTVEFLLRGFGPGLFSGAINILLSMSYMVLLAVYSYAFGSYAATLLAPDHLALPIQVFASGLLIALAVVNTFGADLVVRSENIFNIGKMALLLIFIVVGLAMPLDWGQMAPADYAPPIEILAGAMIIFLNYEGFELIANAGKDIKNPKRTLPIAYVGGVLIAIVLYVLIAIVVLGHLSFDQISANSDSALSFAAHSIMGPFGIIVTIAALLATSSAINATYYGAGRLTYTIAKSGELPRELERNIRGQPLEGMFLYAVCALALVNFLPLNAIATMGSAGFLLIFFAVNLVAVRKAKEMESRAWISLVGMIATAVAFGALIWQVWRVEDTRYHLWILAGMILASFLIEFAYSKIKTRTYNLSG